MGAHKFGLIQQGIVFVCVEVSEPSILYVFRIESKSQVHFCCTFQPVEKIIKFLVNDCFVERLHCVIEYFVSRLFKFGIHQKMLTKRQLFSQPLILKIFHYMFHIHISCFWSAFRVECFCVGVDCKILETLDNKVYTWRWYQVLGRCASKQYDDSDQFGTLWRNWDIGYNTVFHHCSSICVEIDFSSLLKYHVFHK